MAVCKLASYSARKAFHLCACSVQVVSKRTFSFLGSIVTMHRELLKFYIIRLSPLIILIFSFSYDGREIAFLLSIPTSFTGPKKCSGCHFVLLCVTAFNFELSAKDQNCKDKMNF